MFVIDQNIQDAANYLIRHLQGFEQNRALKTGLVEASKIFAAKGRMNLASRIGRNIKHKSRSTGELLRSITHAYRSSRRKGQSGTAVAGFLAGGQHSHLVDSGTKPRYHKSGHYTGIMPANRFWWDAREQEASKAQEVLYDSISRAVDEINARR